MAEASIPVDILNPGQVFACLGFLEVADVLRGDAAGGFDWSDDANVRFGLRAAGAENPVALVLEFLAGAKLKAIAPVDWRPRKEPETEKARKKLEEELRKQEKSQTFPSAWPDTSSAMPIHLVGKDNEEVPLDHWADDSSRNEFKLYAGNRSALDIASNMLTGKRDKPRKGQSQGDLRTNGLTQLWNSRQEELIEQPFNILTPMEGSFNFDPRGAWTPMDAGYSPNDQDHLVAASPVVEILAACGLENIRPEEFATRKVRYVTWGVALPITLARAALAGGILGPKRQFSFELHMAGKNKIVTFAQEEIHP